MKSKNTVGKEPSYGRLLGLIVLLTVTWGIVPAFGKLANMPGDVTTFYVNITALIALVLIISFMKYEGTDGVVRRYWTKLKDYSFKDYGLMVAIGVVWPLVYSLLYFQAIYEGEPVGMTILNYTWPLIVIRLAILKYRKKAYYLSKAGVKFIIPVILTVTAVVFYQMDATISFTARIMVMGLIAALTQALFNFIDHGYDNWIALFVIEATTVVFIVPIMIFTTHYTMVPSWESLGLMSIIGVVGNAIGFWVFMEGRRESKGLVDKGVMTSEPIWLASQGIVPISVLVTMFITNLVSKDGQRFVITTNQIISLVVLAIGLVLFFIFKSVEDRKKKKT